MKGINYDSLACDEICGPEVKAQIKLKFQNEDAFLK